ncbi:MAG: TlpA family protein disulfide reductase [Aureispira sp.]|nr:TlpA family protein disulfide reductase [Aureispira sp.]
MKLIIILAIFCFSAACNQTKKTPTKDSNIVNTQNRGDKEPIVLTEDLGELPKDIVENYRKSLEDQPAPSFSFTDLDGQTHTNESTNGQVVVLKFWFIACKPCVAEIPELNELSEKYKDNNVLFLAPSLDDEADLTKFLEKHEFSYKVGANQNKLMSDFRVFAFPTHIVIDAQGIIQTVLMASPDIKTKEELMATIDKYISKD